MFIYTNDSGFSSGKKKSVDSSQEIPACKSTIRRTNETLTPIICVIIMDIIKIEGIFFVKWQKNSKNHLIQANQLISVDDVPFGYDCVICSQRYSTRTERNEHLETHFIHKNCIDCNQLVILIGDLEFELHRPLHCNAIVKNEIVEPKDIQTGVVIDDNLATEIQIIEDDNVRLKENVVLDEFPELPTLIVSDENPSKALERDILDDVEPKPTAKKRTRKKPMKKSEAPSKDKEKSEIQKSSQRSRTVKTLICTQNGCEEKFRQQLHLRKHLKVAHGIVEKHICSICNFAFADKSNLKHHLVTHTDNKRFICSFCGARFHKLTNMTEHTNAHLGLKPYRCEICNKDFGRANHKRQHMRVNFVHRFLSLY